MLKPVILVCVAFLVAGIVGVGGLYFTDDIDVAIGGFIAAALLQVIVIWNWQDDDKGGPKG
jgi:membrane protein implicated in regulation of membrane protease activity